MLALALLMPTAPPQRCQQQQQNAAWSNTTLQAEHWVSLLQVARSMLSFAFRQTFRGNAPGAGLLHDTLARAGRPCRLAASPCCMLQWWLQCSQGFR